MKRRTSEAGALLAAYVRHIEERSARRRAPEDQIVIVLPDNADVIERRAHGNATEITLRIRSAT